MLSPLLLNPSNGNILGDMKKIILFTFVISFNSFAENSRKPAVLDGTCNLNIPTTITTIVNGKEIVTDRSIEDVLKDQCIEVKKCMYSADDLEMDDLKSLEAVACNNNMSAVTTKTPGPVVENKNFDGKRKAKIITEPEIKVLKTDTPTTLAK